MVWEAAPIQKNEKKVNTHAHYDEISMALESLHKILLYKSVAIQLNARALNSSITFTN